MQRITILPFSLTQHLIHYRPLSLVALLAVMMFVVMPAAAHTEGVMQLAAEPAGPYNLTVWTSPDPVGVGELHVAIAAVLAEDASPVLEADIQVQLTQEEEGATISGAATVENSENKFLHEAVLDVSESGNYLVTITIDGAEGETGEASFPLLVEGGSTINWTLMLVAVAVVASAVILIARYRRNAPV